MELETLAVVWAFMTCNGLESLSAELQSWMRRLPQAQGACKAALYDLLTLASEVRAPMSKGH